MTPWGLVNCKVFGPQGPSLTNRMSELLKYGSVGGVGRKPGPYPAADRSEPFSSDAIRASVRLAPSADARR